MAKGGLVPAGALGMSTGSAVDGAEESALLSQAAEKSDMLWESVVRSSCEMKQEALVGQFIEDVDMAV